MLLPHLPAFKAHLAKTNTKLVLASASPRRREILSAVLNNSNNDMFEIITSKFEENLPHSNFKTPGDYALATARGKAMDVAASLCGTPALIIAADTVVFHRNPARVLEKPADHADAKRMLAMLSGKEHDVCTGVVVVAVDAAAHVVPAFSFVTSTRVFFSELDEATIDAYVATDEPMGKAGAYAIQGLGRTLIHRIDGCYMNVVGFPAADFSHHLAAYVTSVRNDETTAKKTRP